MNILILLIGPNKHQSAVTCLQFDSKFVVTSSDDGTVKLWDVKTGRYFKCNFMKDTRDDIEIMSVHYAIPFLVIIQSICYFRRFSARSGGIEKWRKWGCGVAYSSKCHEASLCSWF